MDGNERISIILIGEHKMMCSALKALFRSQPEMEVIGEAEDSATAIWLAHELKPDVILIDVNMSGMNGIDTTHQISQEIPDIKIVALSMFSQRTFATEMLRAGASGYVLKNHAFSELINAIKAVKDNETYLCPKTTNIIVDDYIQSRSGGAALQIHH